uniref:Uncharacterized protein n=1 Tax=Amphimedon queenslandica TaxID=400682 RepID=A0A1X7V7V5_AMPQE
VHGNAGKTPNHALTYHDILRVIAFIRNYAEVHGICLPGKIPGMKSYENKKLNLTLEKQNGPSKDHTTFQLCINIQVTINFELLLYKHHTCASKTDHNADINHLC